MLDCWKCIVDLMKWGWISAPKLPVSLVDRIFFVMQAYLTNVWRLSFTHAAAIMNIWEGMSLIFPAPLQFLADAFLGNFAMAFISVIFSATVALSVPEHLDHGRCRTMGAESCTNVAQEGLFYAGMVLIALGKGGITFSLDTFWEEQNNADTRPRRCWQDCWEKYLEFVIHSDKLVLYLIGGVFALMWTSKWKLLFGIPAIYTAYVGFGFVCGCLCYKYNHPRAKGIEASPLASVSRVVYAAATSKTQSQSQSQSQSLDQRQYDRFPRCLDRALPSEGEERVETAQFVVRMLLISISFLICGIVSSIGNTYVVEQANHMNRRVGKWNVPLLAWQLPILVLKAINTIYLGVLYDRCKKPITIGLTINGIRTAMVGSVLCCIIAAAVETRRLGVIRSHGLLDKPDEVIPMNAAWLLPQFFLLAVVDSYLWISIENFYRILAPQHLQERIKDKAAQRYLDAAVSFVRGLGFLSSVLSVYVVGKLSGWFQYTLNRSRLDRYYWVLVGLSAANLVGFLIATMRIPRRSLTEERNG